MEFDSRNSNRHVSENAEQSAESIATSDTEAFDQASVGSVLDLPEVEQPIVIHGAGYEAESFDTLTVDASASSDSPALDAADVSNNPAEPVVAEAEPVVAEAEPVAPEAEPVVAEAEPVAPEPTPSPDPSAPQFPVRFTRSSSQDGSTYLNVTVAGRGDVEVFGRIEVTGMSGSAIKAQQNEIKSKLQSGEVEDVLAALKRGVFPEGELTICNTGDLRKVIGSFSIENGLGEKFDVSHSSGTSPAEVAKLLKGESQVATTFTKTGSAGGNIDSVEVSSSANGSTVKLRGASGGITFEVGQGADVSALLTGALKMMADKPINAEDLSAEAAFKALLKQSAKIDFSGVEVKNLSFMSHPGSVDLTFTECKIDGLKLVDGRGKVEFDGCPSIKGLVADGFHVAEGSAMTFSGCRFEGNANSLRRVSFVDISELTDAKGLDLRGVKNIVWPAELTRASAEVDKVGADRNETMLAALKQFRARAIDEKDNKKVDLKAAYDGDIKQLETNKQDEVQAIKDRFSNRSNWRAFVDKAYRAVNFKSISTSSEIEEALNAREQKFKSEQERLKADYEQKVAAVDKEFADKLMFGKQERGPVAARLREVVQSINYAKIIVRHYLDGVIVDPATSGLSPKLLAKVASEAAVKKAPSEAAQVDMADLLKSIKECSVYGIKGERVASPGWRGGTGAVEIQRINAETGARETLTLKRSPDGTRFVVTGPLLNKATGELDDKKEWFAQQGEALNLALRFLKGKNINVTPKTGAVAFSVKGDASKPVV